MYIQISAPKQNEVFNTLEEELNNQNKSNKKEIHLGSLQKNKSFESELNSPNSEYA